MKLLILHDNKHGGSALRKVPDDFDVIEWAIRRRESLELLSMSPELVEITDNTYKTEPPY